MSRRSVVGIGGLLFCVCQPAFADTLYLADGRQLVGAVTQKDENYVIRLKAGELTIPVASVTKWEKDPATVAPAPGTSRPPVSPAATIAPGVTPARTITPEDQKRRWAACRS